MQMHVGKCEWKDEYEIEGPTTNRSYLLKWKGYSAEENSWVTRLNLNPQTIGDYEKRSDTYVYD